MNRLAIGLIALSLLGGCAFLKGGHDKAKTPTLGERIPVLSPENSLAVDPALADVAIALPPATVNPDWLTAGGNTAHSMGNVALGATLAPAWSVSIGEGSGPKARLDSAPVVAGGKVYTIDARAVVRAFNAKDGAPLWQAEVRGKDAPENMLFGGGVSFDNGHLYATNGVGYAAALDAATGKILWIVRPGGPLRGAPTVANDNVYVTSQDNQLYALDPADGKVRWTGSGTIETAGVFGNAAPAASQGTVVAGFSSGELNAYRYENGRVLWQDALSRTSISTAVASLSDVDADPVIDNGRVYAVGQGGRMIALELITGQRIWELNLAGISTPWVAGEWIFVVTDQAKLLAVARATGKVKWITQLPRYHKEKKKIGAIDYVGPILAGDRLILADSEGHLVYVSPLDGKISSSVDIKSPATMPLVVADSTLYVLEDNGKLTAWR